MRSPLRLAAVSALGLILGASFASAQTVVISARGPSAAAFPQGAVLPSSRPIVLRAGDRLEVLDAAGSHVLTGPASISPGQIDTSTRMALQDIFRRANASRPGIAAVRGFTLGGETPPAPPAEAAPLWRLDVAAWQQAEPTDTRNFCLASAQAPILTRSSAAAEGHLEVYREATRTARTLTWPAGAHELAWPSDLPLADSGVYDLNLDSAGGATVRWKQLPADAHSLVDLARGLLDNGCYDQLDTLKAQSASN
jgi:hypothetical protein